MGHVMIDLGTPLELQQVGEFREGVSEIFGMDMTASFH